VPHPECDGVTRACGVAADPLATAPFGYNGMSPPNEMIPPGTSLIPEPCSWKSGLKGMELFNP
jgi:hypothetical protein